MTALEHDWFPRPLPDRIILGERSWLYSSYALHHSSGSVRIGPDSGVYHGTHFELGPDAEVEIGGFCTIVGAIIRTNGRVVIGDHTFIAHEVVIADTPFATPPRGEAEPTAAGVRIGSCAWIGARAIILGGARIGDEAIVGAGAVVASEVPRGATVAGNPARVVSS
ncbi:MAG TPA: acyltransferase [Solirubrobacteraceae bacterium]|jgi:acetyltransferase-like isoleucine patch superfamily enzyme|nr:acyltransferase [Solirubrobacteraceae bacterium]